MSGRRLLVVDDEEPIRKLLVRFLGLRGFTVSVAADGLQALELVSAGRPDLVITDINMPLMNGVDLIRSLRASETTRTVPVVLLTATKGLGDVEYQANTGADAFVLKPVSMTDLLATVERLLAR